MRAHCKMGNAYCNASEAYNLDSLVICRCGHSITLHADRKAAIRCSGTACPCELDTDAVLDDAIAVVRTEWDVKWQQSA